MHSIPSIYGICATIVCGVGFVFIHHTCFFFCALALVPNGHPMFVARSSLRFSLVTSFPFPNQPKFTAVTTRAACVFVCDPFVDPFCVTRARVRWLDWIKLEELRGSTQSRAESINSPPATTTSASIKEQHSHSTPQSGKERSQRRRRHKKQSTKHKTPTGKRLAGAHRIPRIANRNTHDHKTQYNTIYTQRSNNPRLRRRPHVFVAYMHDIELCIPN